MPRLIIFLACFTAFIIGTFADVEYEEHGHHHHHHHSHDGHDHHHHHHSHDDHDHHDHESHKKLFTGGNIGGNDEQQRENLRLIAKKIDVDHDGRISREEMRVYVEERVKFQHSREADELIATLDPENTKKVTFSAYVRDNFGDLDIEELQEKAKDDSQYRETRRTYFTDKAKWQHLDKDGDDSLTYEEFRTFLRPEDDEKLRHIEINSIIKEYDNDGDGKISQEEYFKMTEAETGQAESLSEDLDKNRNGFGEFDEFSSYYLPTSASTIDEENYHLFQECDQDGNGYCTPDEVVRAYSSFAGSQVTDFGADLDSNKEEL